MFQDVTMAEFRTNLKQLLLKKSAADGDHISQRDAAVATGLSLPTINRWYRSDVDRIDPVTVQKLTDYLGCTFAELVEFVPDK